MYLRRPNAWMCCSQRRSDKFNRDFHTKGVSNFLPELLMHKLLDSGFD